MIWGPFLLALALGLVVSAGLYFAYLWPQVEPDDVDGMDAPDARDDRGHGASQTEAETETAEPASESSPA